MCVCVCVCVCVVGMIHKILYLVLSDPSMYLMQIIDVWYLATTTTKYFFFSPSLLLVRH